MVKIVLQRRVFLLFLVALCFFSGCGFKLRGHVNLPEQLKTIAIKKNNLISSNLIFELKQRLQANGVVVIDNNAKPNLVLLLVTNENISVSDTEISASQRMRYYIVTYNISFSLVSRSGKIILPETTVSAQQNITLLPQEILSNSNKLAITKAQLLPEVVDKIIRTLGSQKVTRKLSQYDQKYYSHR